MHHLKGIIAGLELSGHDDALAMIGNDPARNPTCFLTFAPAQFMACLKGGVVSCSADNRFHTKESRHSRTADLAPPAIASP